MTFITCIIFFFVKIYFVEHNANTIDTIESYCLQLDLNFGSVKIGKKLLKGANCNRLLF